MVLKRPVIALNAGNQVTSRGEEGESGAAIVAGKSNESPLCGNSIWTDRMFLALQMPSINEFLHHRVVDVSSIKELVSRWRPELRDTFKKRNTHRALDDIRESIEELRHYREHFFNLEDR